MSSAPPTTQDILGALYVGAIIAAVLFGITNLQVVIYYKDYPNDWWLYRYSVVLLWVLDLLHVALSSHALYFYLINIYGDFAAVMENNTWSMKLQLAVNVGIVVYVQGLYAIRLWKLGRLFHKFLPWFVFLTVAASLGAGIFMTYDIFITPGFAFISNIRRSIYTIFSTIAATDFIIALMMCYYLHKSREGTKFTSTAGVLLRLMRLVLVSGLATSACSLSALIAYIAWPKTLIFLGIDFALPKLYVNSLLAMFNHRRKHVSNKAVGVRQPISTDLRIAPHSSDGNPEEMNMGIALSEIRDSPLFDDHFKGTLDCEVQV